MRELQERQESEKVYIIDCRKEKPSATYQINQPLYFGLVHNSFATFSSAFNCLQYDENCRLLEDFHKIKSGDLTVKSLLSLGFCFVFIFLLPLSPSSALPLPLTGTI